MSDEISKPMHELRNINNRRIVNFAVLQEDNETYPKAIRILMSRFAIISAENHIIERIGENSEDLEFSKSIIQKYKGTPDEGFVRYMMGVTPEEYEFTKEMLSQAEAKSEKATRLSMNERMALEFGARFLSTLNDIEFFELIKGTKIITEEQAVSLRRTYKEIGRTGLEEEIYVPKEWKAVTEEQERETKKVMKKQEAEER